MTTTKPTDRREATRRAKQDAVQDHLRSDKTLNAQFDRISKGMTNGVAKVVKVPTPRKHGRPRGGRIVFTKTQVNTIPEVGYPSDVARALGLKRISVQQWCDLEKDPLPCVVQEEHCILRRDVVVKWLTQTKRFVPR